MRKKILLTLVDLSQLTAFKIITKESNIIDNTIITNMLESIEKDSQWHIIDILNFILPLYLKKKILISEVST